MLASRESNTGDWAAEEGFGYRVALTPVSIAEAMIAACTADENTHASMRSHALEFARKWTWSQVAREFVRGLSEATH